MTTITVLFVVTTLLFLASLPYWLPILVIRLRTFIFTKMNGDEGIQIPGKHIKASEFKKIYANKSVDGRSKGANLSNLFWYWLAPGPEMHQEHIENWDHYKEVASVTKNILSVSNQEVASLLYKYAGKAFSTDIISSWKIVRLRDFVMPICIGFFYELVFEETCSNHDKKTILKHSNNVVSALKCCALRNMPKRNQVTELLIEKLKAGTFKHYFPEGYSIEDKALYLQGVFFTTAVVQMSDALTHCFLTVARHNEVQKKLYNNKNDKHYYDHVISETLRLYPLFGIAHRITTDTIQTEANKTIPKGTVLCFNYPEYHKTGYDKPTMFIPERWETISKGTSNYVPFGVGANRPCPASHMSVIMMKEMLRFGIDKFEFFSSVEHTRSLPNRGACIITSRDYKFSKTKKTILMTFLKVRDQWEKIYTSIIQLLYGYIMIMHAKELKLTTRYYKNPRSSKNTQKTMVTNEL